MVAFYKLFMDLSRARAFTNASLEVRSSQAQVPFADGTADPNLTQGCFLRLSTAKYTLVFAEASFPVN